LTKLFSSFGIKAQVKGKKNLNKVFSHFLLVFKTRFFSVFASRIFHTKNIFRWLPLTPNIAFTVYNLLYMSGILQI